MSRSPSATPAGGNATSVPEVCLIRVMGLDGHCVSRVSADQAATLVAVGKAAEVRSSGGRLRYVRLLERRDLPHEEIEWHKLRPAEDSVTTAGSARWAQMHRKGACNAYGPQNRSANPGSE